jgi:4-hydroxy-4-methyl-2-oxoglutarate aldolase
MSDRETPKDRADAGDLVSLYRHLRVCDVADAMDGIGYFNIGLMDREIRPLWSGMKFWGQAYTMRCVPSNRPMWTLGTTQRIVDAHKEWFDAVGAPAFPRDLAPGTVVVMDAGGGPEVGFWGSENAMAVMLNGAVGLITDGYARDTAEIAAQRTPVVARARARTIIPGRIEIVESQGTIACGGVQVNPGDIVGVDDDGAIVVPRDVALEVATHARAILLTDMRARRSHYQDAGLELDSSVDADAILRYYESA